MLFSKSSLRARTGGMSRIKARSVSSAMVVLLVKIECFERFRMQQPLQVLAGIVNSRFDRSDVRRHHFGDLGIGEVFFAVEDKRLPLQFRQAVYGPLYLGIEQGPLGSVLR